MSSDAKPRSIDALGPPQMAEKAERTVTRKAKRETFDLIVLALLAGAYIGLGGLFATVVMGGGEDWPFGIVQMLAGVVFTLGLILVIVGGAELFTGNILMVMAWAQNALTSLDVLRAWTLAWIFNFIGSVTLAALVFFADVHSAGEGAVGAAALRTAEGKTSLSFSVAVSSGVVANFLVCLAVWLSMSARRTSGKIIALVAPIAAFVAAGLEHSVANMYLIPYGLFVKYFAQASFWTAAELSPASYPSLTLAGLFANLIPVTIGNIIGGLLVGIAYWAAYLRGDEE